MPANNQPISLTLRIDTIVEKKIIGKRIKMSFSENRTFELWHNFMPLRKNIKDPVSENLFSIQIFSKSFDFKDINPYLEFEKWAGLEVSDFNLIPDDFESLVLPGGLYAVFKYTGSAENAREAFIQIFGTLLPNAGYEPDYRPHFEILGEKYKNNDPDSEEEIWIPVIPLMNLKK